MLHHRPRSAGSAAADPARCTDSRWTRHSDKYTNGSFSFGNGTPIYRGPYNDCQLVGAGVTGQGINVHCFVVNDFSNGYYYVVNTTTGQEGWVRDVALNGSDYVPPC